MKWNNMPTFVEDRTFDTRLTKSALFGDFKSDTAKLSQRPDYRQFKSNYSKESLKFNTFFSVFNQTQGSLNILLISFLISFKTFVKAQFYELSHHIQIFLNALFFVLY